MLACSHATPYVRGAPGSVAAPAAGEIDHRLLLIGDAGDPDPVGEPALQALRQRIAQLPGRTTVAFLGDNVYERGLPPVVDPPHPDRAEAERRLEAQVAALRGQDTVGVFIPGNHDWGGPDGWQRVIAQDAYLRRREEQGVAVSLLPRAGCPGPAEAPLGERGLLIVLDTQWWLEEGAKPGPDNNPTECAHTRAGEVQAALQQRLADAAAEGRRAVVAAHHPLATRGPHGGFVDWRAHLFPGSEGRGSVPAWVEWIPLPVVGSGIAWARSCCSPSAQDLVNAGNRRMREALLASMASAPPLVYAGGHDHSLQVFEGEGGPAFVLVSGLAARSKQTRVSHDERTLFAHARADAPGFMQLDFLRDGAVRLAVIEVAAGEPAGREVYSLQLAPPSQPPD